MHKFLDPLPNFVSLLYKIASDSALYINMELPTFDVGTVQYTSIEVANQQNN